MSQILKDMRDMVAVSKKIKESIGKGNIDEADHLLDLISKINAKEVKELMLSEKVNPEERFMLFSANSMYKYLKELEENFNSFAREPQGPSKTAKKRGIIAQLDMIIKIEQYDFEIQKKIEYEHEKLNNFHFFFFTGSKNAYWGEMYRKGLGWVWDDFYSKNKALVERLYALEKICQERGQLLHHLDLRNVKECKQILDIVDELIEKLMQAFNILRKYGVPVARLTG